MLSVYKKFFLLRLLFFFFAFLIPLSVAAPHTKKAVGQTAKNSAAEKPTEEVQNKNASDLAQITFYDCGDKKNHTEPLEEYIKGVISAEMPASYETEALKAQAVAARSYVLFRAQHPSPDHPNAAVCTDPAHCKAYISKSDAENKWGAEWTKTYYPKISSATEDTAGEYLSYKGETVEAFFFALSNGKTENSEDVWQTDVPYLRSAESPGDTESPNFISENIFSVSDFNTVLKNLSADFKVRNNITLSDIKRSSGGRIKSLKINGTQFSGTDIRSAFSLKSTDFSVEQNGEKVIFTVKGNGHGVGMSQYGANYLAQQGKTYEEILKHYYSGVEIINKDG